MSEVIPCLISKDNLVLENIVIGGMQEHQSIKNDGTCTTLTSSMGTGGGICTNGCRRRKNHI